MQAAIVNRVAVSIAFDLECWTDGLYPWMAKPVKPYLPAE